MLQNGTPAPGFSLMDTTGKTVSLTDYAGKVVVLCFVRGKFCPTTYRFTTAWQDFYLRMQELGAQLLLISTDDVATGKTLVEQMALHYPVLSDPGAAVAKQYGAYIVDRGGHNFSEPALIIIDKDGAVAYSIISSGPKGLPDPGSIAPVLIYMHTHGGTY